MKNVRLPILFAGLLASWLASTLCARAEARPRVQIGWRPELETLLLAELLGQPMGGEFSGLQAQALRELGKDQPVVALTARLQRHGLTETALVAYVLRFSEPCTGGRALAQAPAPILQWWRALRAFEALTGPWLKKHANVYQKAQLELNQALPAEDLLGMQERWQRRRFDAYRVYFSPLLGFGAQILGSQGLDQGQVAYALIGPVQGMDGRGTFSDGEKLFYLLLRDFGHAFSDPVADELAVRLYPAYEAVPLRELLARAVGARLMRRLYGPDAYEHHLQGEERQGYALVRPLAEKLSDYEQDAHSYRSLADFADQLEPVFGSGLPSPLMPRWPARRPETGCCSDSARPRRTGQNRPDAAS